MKISRKDFLISTVALEMDASSHPEALKAQAVASNTFFKNLKETQKNKPELNDVDFTVNSKEKIYYLTKKDLKEKWKNNYEQNYNKVASIVDEVYSETLKVNGKCIEALYHDISSGITENNKDVFGNECDYLTSVPSLYDLDAPNYLSTKAISTDEFKETIKNKYKDIKFNENCKGQWVTKVETANTGFVKKLLIGNKQFTGREVRALFKLRSANFRIKINKNMVTFEVKGHGHGVGMSQFGAIQMASRGKTYKEILKHYYKGTEVYKE